MRLLIFLGCLGLGFILNNDALAQNPASKYQVGDVVPNFSGIDQLGKTVDLHESIKKGPVVLMFYRGYWCPYCNQQLSQLEDSLSFISEKGGTVIAVTPEKPEGITKTIKKSGASFKIVHDQDGQIMSLFEVGFSINDELSTKYQKRGIDLNKINGSNGLNLPVPATYVIDSDGKVLYVFYDPNYKKRATVGKILEHL